MDNFTENTDSVIKTKFSDTVAITELSMSPNWEEVRCHQVGDDMVGKVLNEIESVPIHLQFSGLQWKEPFLKRYKQIRSQLQLKNKVLVRTYKLNTFSEWTSVIVVPDILKESMLLEAHD